MACSSSFLTLFSLLLLLVAHSNAHMWLRTPLSQGGLSFAGGTGGPCAGKTIGSGDRTTFEAGESVTFQFRVNQHGPAPFKFALATTGSTFSTIIKDNIPNTVTAGADGFDGVNVQVTIPNTVCDECTIQLSGMGQTDGTGKWYNCASVKIVPAGYSTSPRPTSIAPTSGSTTGGTTVTVTGVNFGTAASSTLKCSFDGVIVSATWKSSTQLTCVSPPKNQPGSSALEVSADGTTFSATGTVFNYTGALILPVITDISPSKGRPGTLLTIKGENFYSSTMLCKFGNKTTAAATVESETKATCTVPTLDADLESEKVSVEVNVDGSPYSVSGETFKMASASSGSSMSGGKIAGIVVGVLVIVAIIAVVVVLVVMGKIKFSSEAAPASWGSKNRV